MMEPNREQLGELLTGHLDGELDAKQSQVVERLLRESVEARALLGDLRKTANLVQALPRHAAPGGIAADVQSRIERLALIGDSAGPASAFSRPRSPWRRVLSLAAMLAFSACGVWLISDVYRTRESNDSRSAAGEPSDGVFATVDDTSVAEQAVPEMPSEAVLASLNLEQKLSNGMGVEAVSQHVFANEPLRLQLIVKDRGEMDAVTRKLNKVLESQLTALPEEPEQRAQLTKVPDSFFFQGRAHVNYAESNNRQILVRAPQDALVKLVDEATDTAPRDESVTLQAGLFEVSGRSDVKGRLRGERTTTATGRSNEIANRRDVLADADGFAARSPGESGPTAAEVDPFGVLLPILGITRADLKLLQEGAVEEPVASYERVTAAEGSAMAEPATARPGIAGVETTGPPAPSANGKDEMGSASADSPAKEKREEERADQSTIPEYLRKVKADETFADTGTASASVDPLTDRTPLSDRRRDALYEASRHKRRGTSQTIKPSDSPTLSSTTSTDSVGARSRAESDGARPASMVIEIIVAPPPSRPEPERPFRSRRGDSPPKPDPPADNHRMQ
jgi:anti-sigma factor RsiW